MPPTTSICWNNNFFQLQFNPGPEVMQHITAIEALEKQLKDLGTPFTEIEIVNKIICMLPPSFWNFLSVWDSLQEDEKTVSFLKRKEQTRGLTKVKTTMILPMKPSSQNSQPNTNRQRPQNYRGSQRENRIHRGSRGCWRGPPDAKRRRLEWHYCQEEGHFIAILSL
jgi:hypothetical protein